MKVIQLQAENFKRLKAVEIAPDGNMVVVGGKNGSGKSSVLDAIYVALVGRSVAPPKPVRAGEEECLIRLDLGDLVVTRKFSVKEGGQYTDSLKVESAEGLRYGKPQEVLDRLLGEIGFDPFEFVQMKPAQQAETLLQMVPLSVDLDELAEQDTSDFAKRRDINRDGVSLAAQLGAIPKEDVPADLPDRTALQEQLGNAAATNAAIERQRVAREGQDRELGVLEGEIAQLEARLVTARENHARVKTEIDARKPLDEPVDVAGIQTRLREADALLAAAERQRQRAVLVERVESARTESQRLTDAMAARERERQAALAKAQMPIEGLGFGIDEKGKPVVTFAGVPFEQASSAEQLRASTAVAMAGNPSLRVLRVKDGALLDEDSMLLLAQMAAKEDFQLWVEVVSPGAGVGIIMEDGEVKATETAEPKAKAKPKAKEPAADLKAAEAATTGGEKLL